MTREEAYLAGHKAGMENNVPLHDLTTYMREIGIPIELRGQWLNGLEEALVDQGFNIEGNDP